jgi:hypothetical protein
MGLVSGGRFLVLCFLIVACGPESKADKDAAQGGRGGAAADVEDTGGPEGPWPCDSGVIFEPPSSPGRGTVTGDELKGTLCTGGVNVYAENATNPDTGELLTALVLIGPGTADPRFVFERPTDIGPAILEGHIGIGSGSAEPGTFTNEDTCGVVSLCGATSTVPFFCYTARAASDCQQSIFGATGDWLLTLTSVTPFSSGSATGYATHGTLEGTFENEDSLDTISVSLEF